MTPIQSTTALDEKPNENISVPHGLIRTVKHYLDFVGLLSYIRKLKTKGIKLDLIVVALAVFTMHSSNSMNACASWLTSLRIRRQIGFSEKDEISQKTLNRAIVLLGKEREGIISALWAGIQRRFEIDNYDISVDGSAIVLYGPKAEMGAIGHPRDKNLGKKQVEFMVAQVAQLGIPIYIKPYKGNTSDEAQYRDCIPEIGGLISGKGLHALDCMKDPEVKTSNDTERPEDAMAAIAAIAMLGATLVADNGAASENNISRATECGFGYITRVKMNSTDDAYIREKKAEFIQLGDGMMCHVHRFQNGKTNYLFFSKKLFDMNRVNAYARYERNKKIYEEVKSGKFSKSQLVKIRKIPGVHIEAQISVQDTLMPHNESEEAVFLRKNIMGLRCGFFKLQSDVYLTPEEVLKRYRRRAVIECLISSLKRITGIKPIRVWNDDSIAGCMMLAVLCEAVLAMARHCMNGQREETVVDGLKTSRTVKPNTESIVRSLNHLTLTQFKTGKGPYQEILSNWEPISEDIFGTILDHESPDWGSKKVPLPS